MIVTRTNMTLSATLATLGYTHHPLAENLQGREVRRDGAAVWRGCWDACWAWLIHTGQISFPRPGACVRKALSDLRAELAS